MKLYSSAVPGGLCFCNPVNAEYICTGSVTLYICNFVTLRFGFAQRPVTLRFGYAQRPVTL